MEKDLQDMLLAAGAALVGVADLESLEPAAAGYRRAVSLAVTLNPSVVAGIPGGPHWDYSDEYNAVNARLDALALKAESWLLARGHESRAVTVARAPYERGSWRTALPHKTVARLAGLGWIGKSALLITPQFGGAQRLTTVLTRAPLAPGRPLEGFGCGRCGRCRDICPGQAISGAVWREGLERGALFQAPKCQAALDARGELLKGTSAACGLCLAVCPYTRRFLRRAAL